jgi:hypothetical protein
MNPEHYELLSRALQVLMGLPQTFSQSNGAKSLQRAFAAGRDAAERIVLADGAADTAAMLRSAATTLRTTGHFPDAELLESLCRLIMSWERRRQPRIPPRRSGDR